MVRTGSKPTQADPQRDPSFGHCRPLQISEEPTLQKCAPSNLPPEAVRTKRREQLSQLQNDCVQIRRDVQWRAGLKISYLDQHLPQGSNRHAACAVFYYKETIQCQTKLKGQAEFGGDQQFFPTMISRAEHDAGPSVFLYSAYAEVDWLAVPWHGNL
jgi:hypothetical protein